MKVPYFVPEISQAEIDEVVSCLESGWLTSGPRTTEFEHAFAAYTEARHAIAVTSCTAAMHLALAALGVGRDDVVLVPTLTFPATANVVRFLDAIPVLVDCEPETLCIDVDAARSILERIDAGRPVPGLPQRHGPVRAIMPMHYAGQMADMAAVRALADDYGLAVVEDAAHALPAGYREGPTARWQSVGAIGDIACFSFYANKCITTGEGGMVTTDSDELAAAMRLMTRHGISAAAWSREGRARSWEYDVERLGFKYNMSDVASALGLRQLERCNDFLAGRQAAVTHYERLLADIPGLRLPAQLEDRRSAWHLYVVRVDGDFPVSRDAFIDHLTARGIGTSVHWRPLHLHTYYRERFAYSEGDFPVAESLWPTLVSMPMFPGLTAEDVETVASVIREIAG